MDDEEFEETLEESFERTSHAYKIILAAVLILLMIFGYLLF